MSIPIGIGGGVDSAGARLDRRCRPLEVATEQVVGRLSEQRIVDRVERPRETFEQETDLLRSVGVVVALDFGEVVVEASLGEQFHQLDAVDGVLDAVAATVRLRDEESDGGDLFVDAEIVAEPLELVAEQVAQRLAGTDAFDQPHRIAVAVAAQVDGCG